MLPLYVHELGGSPLEVALVFSVFSAISIISYPLWGSLSDYLRKRKTFITFGMGALTLIFLLMAFQKNVITLILLRGSTAIFKGAVVPTTLALVSDLSPHEKTGENMGFLGSIEMAGWAFGPILGGLITDAFSFTILWIFVAVECLVGSIIFLFLGSDPPISSHDTKRRFFESFRKPNLISKISGLSISFAIFLLGFSLLGPNLNIYLFSNLEFSKTMIGTLSFIGSGFTLLIQPIIGSYSDKYGRRIFLVFSAINLALGNVFLFLANNLFMTIIAEILIRNYAIFNLIGSAYITDVVPQQDKSASIGFLNSIGAVSRSLGAIIGGFIIDLTNIRTLILLSSIFPASSVIIILLLVKEFKK
jgi:MFS family permease